MTADMGSGSEPVIRFSKVLPDDDAALNAVAELHIDLLPFGPVAGLGFEFVREIGYRVHLLEELLEVVLCTVDGRPAGFVAFTSRSLTFHRKSVGRHWRRAVQLGLVAAIRSPRRLRGLVRTMRMVASRRREEGKYHDPLGEIISLAIKQEFLSRGFRIRSGVWVSERLVQIAINALREKGVSKMRMLVDEGNTAPLLVYHSMGADFEPYVHGGEPNVQVWFDLERVSTGD